MTPMCREMVSQVMVSQVLPAERGGGTRSGRRVPRNPFVAKRPSEALKPQVPRCPGMLENAAYAGGETGPARESLVGQRPISLPGGMGLTAQLGTMWLWQGSQVCWPRPTAPWELEGAHMGSLVSEPGPEGP